MHPRVISRDRWVPGELQVRSPNGMRTPADRYMQADTFVAIK